MTNTRLSGPEEQPEEQVADKPEAEEVPIDEQVYEVEQIEQLTLRRVRTASSIAKAHLFDARCEEDRQARNNTESDAVKLNRENMQRAAYEFIESVFRRWTQEETGITGDDD